MAGKTKEELELEKLEAEVAVLSQPLWKKNLGAVATLVVAIVTFMAGLLSGYFNDEMEELQSEIDTRKAEIEALNAQKKDYNLKVDSLKDEVNSRSSQLEKLNLDNELNEQDRQNDSIEIKRLTDQNDVLNGKNKNQSSSIEYYKNLADDYEKQTGDLSKFLESKAEEVKKLKSVLTLQKQLQTGEVLVKENKSGKEFDVITGTVYDYNGNIVSGANIQIGRYPGRSSDDNGKFYLKSRNNFANNGRTVAFTVTHEDYKTLDAFVVVGSRVEVKLRKRE